MNRHTLSPTSGDAELDQKFSAFFKAQVPQHWPQAPRAQAEVSSRVPSARSEGHRGRVTLAASVACLLGLGLALSYGPTFPGAAKPQSNMLPDSSANGKDLNKHMNPENQPKIPMP